VSVRRRVVQGRVALAVADGHVGPVFKQNPDNV
jgi:hypothetical protein